MNAFEKIANLEKVGKSTTASLISFAQLHQNTTEALTVFQREIEQLQKTVNLLVDGFNATKAVLADLACKGDEPEAKP